MSVEIGKLLQDDFQVWVPFEDGAEILIRLVSTDEGLALMRKSKRITFDNKHQKVEELDNAAFNRALVDMAVKDWKGFVIDGAECPYSVEKARLLMSKWKDFAATVHHYALDYGAMSETEKQARIKN